MHHLQGVHLLYQTYTDDDDVLRHRNFDKFFLDKVSIKYIVHLLVICSSGFGGLGVACWPLVPKFAGSNPAEAVGFLRAKKSSARLPSEGK